MEATNKESYLYKTPIRQFMLPGDRIIKVFDERYTKGGCVE